MGYQEWAVTAPSIENVYQILQQEGVLTGMSHPVAWIQAKEPIPADPELGFSGMETYQRALVLAGDRHSIFTEGFEQSEAGRQLREQTFWIPMEELVGEQPLESLFWDLPLPAPFLDPVLLKRGILFPDGKITGTIRDRDPGMTLLRINDTYLVSLGDTEGMPFDDQILFNFQEGDDLSVLEDGVLPEGEQVRSVTIGTL